MDEQEVEDSGSQSLNIQKLHTSSTKAQIDLLRGLLAQLERECEQSKISNETTIYLPHLLSTFSRPLDREPRRLVQSCLRLFLKHDNSGKISEYIFTFLLQEAQKGTIASSNAFVLLEWCTIIDYELAKLDEMNDNLLIHTVQAQALLLYKS